MDTTSMIKFVGVLPYAYKPYYEDCRQTMKPALEEFVYQIDNTEENVGVAESWNRGIYYMKKFNADWLIIISAAIRFGTEEGYEPKMDAGGGLDLLRQIETHQYAHVIHFATKNVPQQNYVRGESPGYAEGVLGWHLTAIRRDVIEKVGYFDANFYPVYFEDIDYDLRIRKAYQGRGLNWLILPVDAVGTTIGHGVTLGKVDSPAEPNIAYFATKWGRHPSATMLNEYDRPFNDPLNSLAFFPPARGRSWNED